MTSTNHRNRIPNLTPIQIGDSWYIRFSFKGKMLKQSLGKGKQAHAQATILGDRIKQDIALGVFCGEIQPYLESLGTSTPKPQNKTLTGQNQWDRGIIPSQVIQDFLVILENDKASSKHLGHYKTIHKGLLAHNENVETFLQSKTPDTANRHLKQIKTAYRKQDLPIPLEIENIKPRKAVGESKDVFDDVFTPSEIKQVLDCLGSSADYSHYLPFVKFRFLTGVRPCEGIALQWQDINWESKHITIKRSYTELDGLKGRKNGETTILPMNDSLMALLTEQKGLHETIVFPSPKGTYINLNNFNRRAWEYVKQSTGINKRFYAIRHTVLSHIVQSQGLASAAYVAGQKSLEMVTRHYGKLIDMPELPMLAA